MYDFLKIFSGYSDLAFTVIAFVGVLLSLVGTIHSGVLKQIKLGPIKLDASESGTKEIEKLVRALEVGNGEKLPFETEQLASYYSQVLAQSKTSFWFSLVFASIGFCIIVIAAFMHSAIDSGSTIARFVAGGIVDAVAALFFVQSKRAQESMAEFFDKLRRDRNHVEARKLCEALNTPAAKDALRVRLALHYAEVLSPDTIAESIFNNTLSSVDSKIA